MFWIPAVNEKFLIQTEDGLMRSMRVPTDKTQKDFITFYLVDTGEICIYRLKKYPELYLMKESAKNVPGVALKCVEADQNDYSESSSDNSKRLQVELLVHKKVAVEVIDVLKDKLIVKIFSYDDSLMTSQLSEDSGTNQPNQSHPTNGYFMTKEEEEQLKVDLNTSDAEIAVHGFKPSNEEDRLCKFYDPEIKGCFKRGRCRLRHELKVEDDFVDTMQIFFENISKCLPNPELHSIVNIKITHFQDVNKFYCLYSATDVKSSSNDGSVESIVQAMNEKEIASYYKPITSAPDHRQLVIVKINGTFYRGRVEEILDSHAEIFTVLLVDFGNVVKLWSFKSNLYEWYTFFDYFPFQTITMTIANIQPISKSLSAKGIDYLEQVLNDSKGELNAFIFDNLTDIECQLLLDDMDLGDELIDRGLASKKVIFPPSTNNNLFQAG
jgi:Tudor domain